MDFIKMVVIILCVFANQCKSAYHRVGLLKILGGREVERYSYPWQALIHLKLAGGLSVCGGALVHSSWVLTAGSCLRYSHKQKIEFGVWNRTNIIEGGRTTHSVEKVIQHPCYKLKDSHHEYDLVLIKLRRPELRHKPVCIQAHAGVTDMLKNGKDVGGCVATGYGYSGNGGLATILRKVKFPSVSTVSCPNEFNNKRNICGRDGEMTSKQMCMGDLGGPLVCPTSRAGCDGYFLAGISIEYSSPCTTSYYPSVFASVHRVLPWITNTIKGLGILGCPKHT